MEIKFNKLVTPVVPLTEGNLQKPAQPATPAPTPEETAEEKAFVEKVTGSIMEELPPIPQPEAVKEQAEEITSETVSAPVAAYAVPASRTGLNNLEDTLRKFLGKQVRIYTADHESVAGKLEIVENGWVKVCNARSAGSDYYFDEDILNTSTIVRIRASVIVDKKQYVEFMNIDNNNKQANK